MIFEKVKITAGVVVVASILSIMGYFGWKDFRRDMQEQYEREHAHYIITDLSTGKSWESVKHPKLTGWNDVTFETADDTQVILENSNITIKRLP